MDLEAVCFSKEHGVFSCDGGQQLEDISVGLKRWASVYKWIHNRFPLHRMLVCACVFPVT